jgi:hypothetical protein
LEEQGLDVFRIEIVEALGRAVGGDSLGALSA